MMSNIVRSQFPHARVLVPLSQLERFAVWHPHQAPQFDRVRDQGPSQQESVKTSHGHDAIGYQSVIHRVLQSQINACFIGIFALLGITLALANATPNQEIAEVETLSCLLVILLVPLGCNRAGATRTASAILTLLPTIALAATFLQPLPSGRSALTWTYDAGLAFAGLGALLAALVFPSLVAWFLTVGGIIVPLTILTVLMPHSPSLVGLDIDGGIVSPHWSLQHQQLYALYDFLFRPFLLIILLGLIGTRLRRLVFLR